MVLSILLPRWTLILAAAPLCILMAPAGNTDARYSTFNDAQGNVYHVQGNMYHVDIHIQAW
jgi:hypothetical protein